MNSGNELTEIYDSLSVLYKALPPEADSEWKSAVRSVLYGDAYLADAATCYGAQQRERNLGKREDYAQRHGNGKRVTEFSEIRVSEPRPDDVQYLPSDAALPVAPESEEVLRVMVSAEEVDEAISLLAELPAEPSADRPGNGVEVLLDPGRVRQARRGTSGTHEETTVLFVSDTHLGYENRAETGRGKTVSWADDISSEKTLARVLRVAIEQQVDAIIHTGDILDHEVDAATLDAAASSLATLSQLDTPVYCIIGSHDHDSGNPQHRRSVDGIGWLEARVTQGQLTELSTEGTVVAGGPLSAYGVSAGNVGIDDVGKSHSRDWNPSDIRFDSTSPGPNVLCLHDGLTPYRDADADVDLSRLLDQSRVSFDCVLIGDEHRPINEDFDNGYTFETDDGTPVFYTGPAVPISEPYRDRDAFVTELTISDEHVTATRHSV